MPDDKKQDNNQEPKKPTEIKPPKTTDFSYPIKIDESRKKNTESSSPNPEEPSEDMIIIQKNNNADDKKGN